MSRRVVVDPITRIEGHLNVRTTIENGVVVDAQCMSEMFRGFEIFLQGRDPLDAQQITQRICGVCPYAHAITSSYAQENAYKIQATANGRIMHNLIQGANHLYDYLLHFYQLSALDFVDITAVLKYTGKDAGGARQGPALSRRHGEGLRRGGPGALPRRRQHRDRNSGGRGGCPVRPFSVCRGRSPDRQRPLSGRQGCGLAAASV